MPSHLIVLALVLALFRSDETIRNYGMGEDLWRVTHLNGTEFKANATLKFTGRYTLSGTAPCNSYRTRMDIPFPWFQVGPILSTRTRCANISQEQTFFAALRATTIAKIEDGVLILSDDQNPLITLKRAD